MRKADDLERLMDFREQVRASQKLLLPGQEKGQMRVMVWGGHGGGSCWGTGVSEESL